MTASKIRVDYEQLTQIAQAFGQQAETAQKMLSALQKNLNTLQGGDWIGKGADAFYAEMNSAQPTAGGQLGRPPKFFNPVMDRCRIVGNERPDEPAPPPDDGYTPPGD